MELMKKVMILITSLSLCITAALMQITEVKAATKNSTQEEYFSHTLFAGDSITLGLQKFVKECDSVLKHATFYCRGGYGLRTAIRPLSVGDTHPLYNGEMKNLWDVTTDEKFERVYLMFGLNDIGVTSVDDAYTNYLTLINNILEDRPDIEIIVMSTTAMLEGAEYPHLNNENIRALNKKMKTVCEEKKWQFLDISTSLTDARGYLMPQFCSDGYLHLSKEAYTKEVIPLITNSQTITASGKNKKYKVFVVQI